MRGRTRRSLLLWLGLAALATGCKPPTDLVVFHAASLRRVLAEAAAEYERANPKVRVRLEPSGSQVAIRKVTEQGLQADLVAVADASLIDAMMVPQHAAWNLEFATNELVLAHLQHSRFTDEVSSDNWPEVLLRPGVRLGRVNPDTAPIGYHTLFAWQLAERSGAYGDAGQGLEATLRAAVSPAALAVDETELLGQLEARAIDYAFLYRSTAEDHRLKVVTLPEGINLGQASLAATYATASVEVKLKQAEGTKRLLGRPITYGLTIPERAAHRAEAERFVAFLAGERGGALLRGAGFRPRQPAVARPHQAAPASLRAMTQPAKEAPPQSTESP